MTWLSCTDQVQKNSQTEHSCIDSVPLPYLAQQACDEIQGKATYLVKKKHKMA